MIEFSCKNCGQKLSVQDQHSGKRVKCPKCGSVGAVPDNSDKIKFNCQNCGQSISVPQIHAGKKGKCPKCKNIIIVPTREAIPAKSTSMVSFTCSMCNEAVQVPETSIGQIIECPECGSYIETSSGGALGESGDSIPPTTDDEPYQEPSYEPEEPAGIDRRLIVIISTVAAVVVVGLVILVAVLRLSRPRPQRQVADTGETVTQLELDEVKTFVERYISLLENGEVDEAFQLHSPGLADDAYKLSFERLSGQIGKSRIIEMNCTRTQREQHPERERVLLWYNLRCEEGTQTVNVSVLPIEQELKIDGITARDNFGHSVSIGARGFAELSKIGTTTVRQRIRPSPGKFYFSLAVGFTIGTFFSAVCLWIGMKLTRVEGTFMVMFGIAAISSLAGIVPAFIGIMPCVGWLFSLILMFVLICKWTDAEFWPDAVGIVVISAFVGIFAQRILGFIISIA